MNKFYKIGAAVLLSAVLSGPVAMAASADKDAREHNKSHMTVKLELTMSKKQVTDMFGLPLRKEGLLRHEGGEKRLALEEWIYSDARLTFEDGKLIQFQPRDNVANTEK